MDMPKNIPLVKGYNWKQLSHNVCICLSSICLVLLVNAYARAETSKAPVLEWRFNEGNGDTALEYRTQRDAQIHGAHWVKHAGGYAVRLDGVDDYIDTGDLPAADLRGPLTMEVWVHPDQPAKGEPGIFGKWFEQYALTYYRGSCWFYIGSGANKVHAPLPVGQWSHVVAVFDGEDLRLYINGEKAHSNNSTFTEAPSGNRLYIGGIKSETAETPTHYFAGMIGAARLYDYPLSWKEVAHLYNPEATMYGLEPVDLARFDTLSLQLYPYPERDEVVVRINTANVTLPRDQLSIEVGLAGVEKALTKVQLPKDRDVLEVTLNPGDAAAKQLHCRAVLIMGNTTISTAMAETPWAPVVDTLPDINSYCVPPLPGALRPPRYNCTVQEDGLITVGIHGEDYHVASRFSYPQGGFNTFGKSAVSDHTPETRWSVLRDRDDGLTIIGEGAYYRIIRTLTVTPTRVVVVDRFENKTDTILGIMLEHVLGSSGKTAPVLYANPTVFLAGERHGAGLVTLDDVFYLRAETRLVGTTPVLADHHLGIPPKGSHTVRWAIYPVSRPDYYDFINQVREDEQVNGYVPGAFAFTSSWEVPDPALVDNKALSFYSWASLTRVLHNPTLSLEGWEFTDYPELCETIRNWIKDTRTAYPDLETTFHVAHSLFATHTPEALFPDSLAIDAAGNMLCYGGNSIPYYNRYFSPELVQDGWRWWIYYPTLENSFGKRMLEAADYMIQDLGATSVWADGYISGYVRDLYTYDHWDGVSVTIDPETKTVSREKALVPHVAMPVLKAVAQKYTDAGGYLITNGNPGPFSFNRMPVISSCETSGGDQQPISKLHLARTITPLGNPVSIRSFQDCYDDILGKLDHGALYFWYGEGDVVTEETIVSRMYPITLESIRPGTVRGKERIVTKVSGVYGWPGDRSLHYVHFYDGRGRKRPRNFLTTVDEQGARTEVVLHPGESAVIERLPVQLERQPPMNVQVLDVSAAGIRYRSSLTPDQLQEIPQDD